MQQAEIDIQLWEYIDGTCTAGEKGRINSLLANDKLWQARYRELLELNSILHSDKEIRHVPEHFTAEVMDKIEAADTRYAARKQRLNVAIGVIVAFFIGCIGVLLLFSLADAGSYAISSSGYKFPEVQIPDIQVPSYISFVAGFMAVIMLLAVGDKVLRNRTGYRL